MTRYYCTFFDRNYLSKAVALFGSLQRHEAQEYKVIAICLDEISRIILLKMNLLNVELVPLHLIEKFDSDLLVAKGNRDLIEYYWTLTASVVLYLLDANPVIEQITYLDADLFFYSSPSPIFEEMGENSIVIHEHRYSSTLAHLVPLSGRFNVGLLVFRNDPVGRATLKWWRERCIEWCYLQFGSGKMGDQMYLDEWPTRFEKVYILQNLGAGVAPWNHEQYSFCVGKDAVVTIDGFPLIFYHFHALFYSDPDVIIPAKHVHYPLNIDVLKYCYLPYLAALDEATHKLSQILPGFYFGLNTGPPNIQQTFIMRREKVGHFGDISGTHARIALNQAWDCYCSEQFKQSSASNNMPLLWPAGRPVSTCDDLLLELEGLEISQKIRVLYIIGAHLFQESEIIYRMFPSVEKIYLFEAIPQVCEKLTELFGSDSRIEIFSYAISDKDEQSFFHVTSNSWESSSLLPLGKHLQLFPTVHELGVIPVECRTVESIIAQHHLRQPDMLFIDVQGAEYRIISSLSPELKENVKLIYTEASHEELYVGARPLDDIIALLHDRYHFLGFAPLFNGTPTHGNALFVNHEHVRAIKKSESISEVNI